ncbi:MAG: hypothetical protein ACRC2T_02705 [Thermoguttaceae bacterium]
MPPRAGHPDIEMILPQTEKKFKLPRRKIFSADESSAEKQGENGEKFFHAEKYGISTVHAISCRRLQR